MKNLLKQIVNNTEPKRSFSIVVNDNKNRLKSWFKPPIQLDKKKDYEIALINLETYYSFPNIDRSNNSFSYSQNLKNLNHIFDDHVGSDMTKEEFRQLCRTAWEKQHRFVIIDLRSKKHNGKYRSGLDKIYIPN